MEPALADVDLRRLHATSYNSQANTMLCVAETQAPAPNNGSTGNLGSTAVASAGCDNNWAEWNVGTRTQWNIDSQTYIGVDVVYQHPVGDDARRGGSLRLRPTAEGDPGRQRPELVDGSVPRAS